MFKLSAEGLKFVKDEMTKYESEMSAIIPSLYRAQKENDGWISPEVIEHLSEVMEIPASRINEVFKFYTMFNQEPVGKHHIQVCCNISCAMQGGRELTDEICKSLGIKEGEVSKDGKYSVSRVECLGSCGTAPMMQVNEDYHENLTADKAIKILKGLE